MDCDKCKACDRVKDINGQVGSMDCDKTPEKIRWLVHTGNIQSWAISNLRIAVQMLGDHSDILDYAKREWERIDKALKEQYAKEPKS